jgi:signal transduction histidine kinase
MNRPPGRRRVVTHLPARTLGWTLTAVTVWQLDRSIDAKNDVRFVSAVDRLAESIARRLATYTDMLRAGAGMIDASGSFDHQRFRTFVQRLELKTRYPGIQGVGFTARIAPADLASVVRTEQGSWPAFKVWPEGPRDEYHAILDLEPMDERNRQALGYDMFTEPVRRAAMERARDTGEPAASGPVTLVQEIDEDKQPGFLIYVPVYRGPGPPGSVERRRESLVGFVYSPFRAGDLFQGILFDQSAPAGFRLVDAGSPGVVLHATSTPEAGASTIDRTIDAGGRQWQASFFALPVLEQTSTAGLVPIVGWLGALITMVVAGLVALQTAARLRLEVAEHKAREHAAAMEVARAEAERVNRVKDEFLATLSHELRTPLNAMLGWLQMLERGSIPEGRRAQALETVIRNAEVQSKLIDDLLDMSRIISGRLRMEPGEVRMQEIVDAAVAMVRTAADAKGITLYTSYEEVPVIVADGGRLQQVVWNLLTNAVKFTPAGGHIAVTLTRGQRHLELEVRDTGVGIAPEFLAHVFDAFRQADASTAREHTGLGLGLSIVRNLVELHGGSVEARSEGQGQGAAFLVRIPLIEPRSLDAQRLDGVHA